MCRRFLAQEWMVAMRENGVDRIDQKMMALQDITWFVIFEGIWNTRNEILHNQGNYYEREGDSKLNSTIRWFVENKYEALRWGDQLLANIDLTRLQYMRRSTKKRWIEHVETAKKDYGYGKKAEEERTDNDNFLF